MNINHYLNGLKKSKTGDENKTKEKEDKLKYYTLLYKIPKYLEKVNIIINEFVIYSFSVFFILI